MSERSTLVAIGNFDGVHRGHQAVLADAVGQAEARTLQPVVLTFDPHPAVVLGRKVLPVLTGLQRKQELIAALDPRLSICVEHFTPQLAASSPVQFAQSLLVDKLRARHVIVGQNFHFGQGRSGNFQVLCDLGERLGFSASAQPLLCVGDTVISSSAIREALQQGDLPRAEELLGRPHSLSGKVVHGQGRGRTLGVPTANLAELNEVMPAFGVYACLVDRVAAPDQPQSPPARLARAVANVGVRPTFGGTAPSIEVHLFDFEGDLYDQWLRVHLVQRLRAEQSFASVDELVQQIGRDMQQARAQLQRRAEP